MILSLMASPVTSIAEAEMGFVEGVTYWENALTSVYAPICVTSQSRPSFQVKVYKCILPSCNAVRWGFVRGGGISIMLSSVVFMMSTSVSYLFPSFTADDS